MQNILGREAFEIIARVLAFLTAIPLHETAHAFISEKLGDPTARQLGRLTLNPIKHIDPLGLLSMLLIGFGWAKPVPINPNYYKNRKVGMAVTAAAGPISNILLAFINMVLLKLVVAASGVVRTGALSWWMGVVIFVLFYLIIININLALFNLIPVPPFDGSRIIGLILPEKWYFGIQKYERVIMVVFLVLLWVVPRFLGWNPLGWLLVKPSYALLNGFDHLTGYVGVGGLVSQIDAIWFGSGL